MKCGVLKDHQVMSSRFVGEELTIMANGLQVMSSRLVGEELTIMANGLVSILVESVSSNGQS